MTEPCTEFRQYIDMHYGHQKTTVISETQCIYAVNREHQHC